MGNCVSSGAAAVLPDEHIVGTVSPPTEFALYATAAAPETLGNKCADPPDEQPAEEMTPPPPTPEPPLPNKPSKRVRPAPETERPAPSLPDQPVEAVVAAAETDKGAAGESAAASSTPTPQPQNGNGPETDQTEKAEGDETTQPQTVEDVEAPQPDKVEECETAHLGNVEEPDAPQLLEKDENTEAPTTQMGGKEDKRTFNEWAEAQCWSMKYIPGKGSDEMTRENEHPEPKDMTKSITQGCMFISSFCTRFLMTVDLNGGTLFDWWTEHISKGEAETDLTGDELFDRAVVGLKATVFPELRRAVENGVDEDEMENQYLKATIKNVFRAPPPPEGTTGCGEDGDSQPEPHTWVVGGDMYAFGPSHVTESIISKDRKYVVGGNNTRAEVEKAMGRSLGDDEVVEMSSQDEKEGERETKAEAEEEPETTSDGSREDENVVDPAPKKEEPEEEDPQEEPGLLMEWLEDKCAIMKEIPPASDLVAEDIHYSLKDKSVTQCQMWMVGTSELVLKFADLGGGTLFDWWETHIAQGGEENISGDDLFSRAVAGLIATMPHTIKDGIEEYDGDKCNKESWACVYKNVFEAPPPPVGEGQTPPSAYRWVAGGGLHALVPPTPKCIMTADRKYLLGVNSREEVEEFVGRPLQDDEVTNDGGACDEPFGAYLAQVCDETQRVPRDGNDDRAWEKDFLTRNPGKTLTQGHRWIRGYSDNILTNADLDGGTLFDWWNTHVAKGNLEASLTQKQVFNRACAGLGATTPARVREAIEAGDNDALQAAVETNMTLKNMWGAPPPPQGTTGCGPDGTSEPEPCSWVFGGDMYAFGHLAMTRCIMNKDRKYVQGAREIFTRDRIEKHLGRPLEADEMGEDGG